ncbi:MAG: glutathione S-transferase [Sphingomonas sp.]|mgnify:CR=1 FL=1|nr:glutathione S-transferase [Sphingomonas sp.]
MADDLIFYTHPMSRGRIARWMLEEVGQPYETRLLDFATTMKAAEYLAVNPMGKVPAIRHKDRVITECGAICAYLADAFPDAGLSPDPAERADYYRWFFFAAGPVEQVVTNKALGFTVNAEQSRMAGYGSHELALDVIEHAVSAKPFLAGERFSAVDVYFGSQLGWGVQFGILPDRPAFRAYLDRIFARPAYKRASEIDDALIAEQEAAAAPA